MKSSCYRNRKLMAQNNEQNFDTAAAQRNLQFTPQAGSLA